MPSQVSLMQILDKLLNICYQSGASLVAFIIKRGLVIKYIKNHVKLYIITECRLNFDKLNCII